MEEYLTLEIAHLLIFTIPGFFLVWSFNKARGVRIQNDFEYLIFSSFLGFVLLAVLGEIMTKENRSVLFENIYAGVVFLSFMGMMTGYILGSFEKLDKSIDRVLDKRNKKTFNLNLNDRSFHAIKNGTKKVEGRTQRDEFDKRYDEMKKGDYVVFINDISQEKLICEVLEVRKYDNTRSMLESEGLKNVLSSGGNIEEGIESYNNLEGYEERIKKFGIYAIGIKIK